VDGTFSSIGAGPRTKLVYMYIHSSIAPLAEDVLSVGEGLVPLWNADVMNVLTGSHFNVCVAEVIAK